MKSPHLDHLGTPWWISLSIQWTPNSDAWLNPKREFFRIEPDQAIAILKLLNTEDVTAEVAQQNTDIDAESVQAAESLRSRRPNFNFAEMGIPVGCALHSVDNKSTAAISAPKKARYMEQELTLTAATREMLGIDYSVQPGPHWTYNGKSLHEIYEETYTE